MSNRNSKNRRLTQRNLFDMIIAHRGEQVNFCCALYRSDIIKDHNILFPTEFRYGEDTCFFLEYSSYCVNGGVLIDLPMYRYYVRSSSAMHTVDYDRIHNIYAHRKGLNYWKKVESVTEHEINKATARAVWAALKDFAIGDKKLYKRFRYEHDIDKYIYLMSHEADESEVRISSKVYMISPLIFRWLVKGYSVLKRN